MSNPTVTIFVRHSPGCKWAGEEFHKGCSCRKHLRWSHGGKQHRMKTGSRSWTDAETAKRTLEDQLAGRVVMLPDIQAQTIRAAHESFIRDKEVQGLTPDGLRKYRLELGRFVAFCEGCGIFAIAALTLPTLTEYRATWQGLYPSSYTRSFVQKRLRVFLHYCQNAGWLTKVPKMAPVKVSEPPTLPLTDAEYMQLLDAVPLEFTNGSAARVRAIVQLMRWSGLAVRDASMLRTDELLYSSRKTYHVTTARQKTGVHVSVPIPPDVALEILAVAIKGADYLFYTHTSCTPVSFAQKRCLEISRAFRRAGIRSRGHMVSHRLRDTFAVDLLQKGVPLEEVSKLLGHESISTTERHYSAWVKGRQDRLDNLVTATWK